MVKSSQKIHNILNKICITPQVYFDCLKNDSDELSKKILQLKNYLELNSPEKLYKYRRYNDNSVQALINDEIYLSRADFFNDPYDCLLYFNKDVVLKNISDALTLENLKNSIEARGISPTDEIMEKMLETCFEKKNLFLKDVSNYLSEVPRMHQKNMFISCFSETVSSPLMWSHYSDNHRGFAIEYRFDIDYFCPTPYTEKNIHNWHGFRSLLPINYSNSKCDATSLANWYAKVIMNEKNGLYANMNWSIISEDLLLSTKLALNKSKDWSYEKEWRLIVSRECPIVIEDECCFVKKKATAIYVGEQMDEYNKNELLKIARNKKIPIYEMYSDYSSKNYSMSKRRL